MLDIASSDSLTQPYTPGQERPDPGSPTRASSPFATALPASDALTTGRVGVAVDAVSDDALGYYEFGEAGHGISDDVIVEACVLVDAGSVAGVELETKDESGIACFAEKGDGATYATLLTDCTADDGAGPSATINRRFVVLHSAGKAGAGGGGGSFTGDSDDIDEGTVHLFLTVSERAAIAAAASEAYVDSGDAATLSAAATASEAYTDAAIATAVLEADYNANTILAADTDNTPTARTIDEQRVVLRLTGGNIKGGTAAEVRTLINVEDGADVTDAANVAAAGALMDTEFDEARLWAPFWAWDAGNQSITSMTNAAINSGTQAMIGDAKWGSAWQVTAAASTDDSGQLLIFGANAITTFVGSGREFFAVFRTPTTLTDVAMRYGWGNFATTGPGTDGIYFEMLSSTLSMICRLASANTTHATTVGLSTDTEYRLHIRRNASDVTFTAYSAAGAQILTGTQAGMPADSVSLKPGAQLWHDAVTGGAPKVIGRIYRMGTRYIA